MLVSARNGHEAENMEQRNTSRRSTYDQPTSARDCRPLQFRKALKRDAKLRLALTGPSGSGKTYTLLKIAAELGGPVALVDTERGSAEKYADLFDFDTLSLESFSPDLVPQLIQTAVGQGYKVLIIDSLSHFWSGTDGELDQVEQIKRRLRDNGFAAWREVTPKHNRMIDAMLSAPMHILVSMRVKTEWVMETEERTGKTKPRKVGLQPVMRDGIEYEFDVCGEMDQENTLQITKSRCPNLSGRVFPKPGKDLAEVLKQWLGSSVTDQPPVTESHRSPEEEKELGMAQQLEPSRAIAIPQELTSIWQRMCHPRGVAKEFEGLRIEIEQLAGSTGVAEYSRILREHGVDQPKRFKSAQPARICAKAVFELLQELRANARENQSELALETADADGKSRILIQEGE